MFKDDDLNGIWYLAHEEPDGSWPAWVVEALAGEVISSRGRAVSDILSTARLSGESVHRSAIPMARPVGGFASQRILTDEPEFHPAEVEDELRTDGGLDGVGTVQWRDG